MWSFGTLCDQFYVTSRLYFKLDLEPSRETLLMFFDQFRKAYPQMTRLRRRDDGVLVLEEDSPEGEARRYVRLEAAALKFGIYNPPAGEDARRFGEQALTQATYHLSLSELDFDYMEVAFCFDLEFRGNHDELVAEAILGEHPLASLFGGTAQKIIDCQPFFGVTLSEDCSTQAYLEIKSRTSTFEVRSGDYDGASLTVYLTLRRYFGIAPAGDLVSVHQELLAEGARLAAERVVPAIVQPLAAAIASRR